MQLFLIRVLILFLSLFVMTQGSAQLAYVLPVENAKYAEEYRCVTKPVVEDTEYTWHKQNMSQLPDGVKAEGDRLHFLKSTRDLNGLYICKVENRIGSAAGSLYRHQKHNHSEL